MTKTCSCTAELFVDGKAIEKCAWDGVDVMKTSHTYGWARKRFNAYLKDFDSTIGMRDKVISAYWRCDHGAPNYTSFTGALSGTHGRLVSKSGIFDQ